MVLGIYGSGGVGREVRDIAERNGKWNEIVFIDDTVNKGIFEGIKRIPFEDFCVTYTLKEAEMIIALGEPEDKISLYNKVKKEEYSFVNVIDHSSIISPTTKLEKRIIIYPGVFISSNVLIRDNVCVGARTVISHDCVINRNCQIASGTVLGGGCVIGEGTYIGVNASIRERISVGANSVIGMGAVVIQDIPENVIAIGNPAKVIRYKNCERVFRNM